MFSHRHYEECASTNDLAKAWAVDNADPAPHGALVSADFQTRGRGRRGRQWQAAPGESVLMSVVLRPAFAQSDAWQLAFVAALAACDAVRRTVPQSNLKWPNDILVDGNKAGGVLVETVSVGKDQWAAIVGIGVNVHQTGFDADAKFQVPPISLKMAAGDAPPTATLTAQIAQALQERLAQHAAEGSGWEAIRADWRARMAPNVVLRHDGRRGICTDLEPDGRARVQLADGTFETWATVDPEDATRADARNAAVNRV